MPSIYTAVLALEKMAPGEDDDSWGDKTNANLDTIDYNIGVGWRPVAYQVFTSPQAVVRLALPSAYTRFRIVFQDFSPPTPAAMYVRFSVDGGATFLATNEYIFLQQISELPVRKSPQAGSPYIPLSADDTAAGVFGHLEFEPYGGKAGIAQCTSTNSTGGLFTAETAIGCRNNVTATHIEVGFVNALIAAGRIKLLGSV